MRNYPSVGVQVADILLPKQGLDPYKWATIAVDQFTSQPEYWEKVAEIVGSSPSTYNLVLPEVFLGKPDEAERVQYTQNKMREYILQDLFDSYSDLIYVERTSLGKTRHGLMLALDLEKYDFSKGSQTPIRATEGTILDRLPPRMRIREGAILELPHILVLIDDFEQSVIEPITAASDDLPLVYDFELMLNSGHLTGRRVNDPAIEGSVIAALEKLASPEVFQAKYGVAEDHSPLLFAVGDGNHSLATAKAIWDKIKPAVGMDHPSRYALVEIENVHDVGLEFEPIHRVLFDLRTEPRQAMLDYFGENIVFTSCATPEEMISKVGIQVDGEHTFGYISSTGIEMVHILNPSANLPVGSLQPFLDDYLKTEGAAKIDYVHGAEVTVELATQSGNCGFYLPAMPKNDLFKTVIMDGALPRKTFSMGEAIEKRFYMEARRIA